VTQLALAVEHVDRDDDQPELHPCDPQVDHLDPVREEERDAIAGLESARIEDLGQSIAALFKFAKRKFADAMIWKIELNRWLFSAAKE
jgi:hypothetical protein